jgi:hypothetical protein
MRGSKAKTSIGDLQAISPWWRISCTRRGCGRVIASSLAPFAERWGADASSDVIRRNLVCKCGHRGVDTTHPSWGGTERGFEPFPGEGVELSPSRLL